MPIIGINASPFINGKVATCLNTALSAAQKTGAEVGTYQLQDVPHDDGRREEKKFSLEERVARLPASDLTWLVKLILEADGIIFATPTRNFTASSRMLALLSWLQVTTDAPDYALKGKVAGFMAVCEEDGAQSANEAMVSPTNHMGLIIPPFCTYFQNKFAKKSEDDWQETDQTLVGLNVRRMVQVLRGEIKVGDWNDGRIGSW